MSECTSYTLAEVVDRFLIRNGIVKRKFYTQYLVLAEEVWEDIFQNTLWVIKSVWQPIKSGTPYNYVDLPTDCQRLLGVGVTDQCNLIQPLYYNNQINVISKPTVKKCGCSCPDCGGMCSDVNSLVTTTKLIFTINGVGYYQKCWLQYCPNGDMIEYCETPTKKYNSLAGDGGDYDSDEYNDDYLIGTAPFSDYTIEYIISQKKICKLDTLVCGCPKDTVENEQLFLDCCGFYLSANCGCRRKKCNQISQNVNNNQYGQIKISSCATKIYYEPSHLWKTVTTKEFPDYLLVSYQSTGTTVGAETLIPRYARNVFYAALDNGRKEYNSAFSQYEKDNARYKYVAEKQALTSYLNPLDLDFMSNVQDIKILW